MLGFSDTHATHFDEYTLLDPGQSETTFCSGDPKHYGIVVELLPYRVCQLPRSRLVFSSRLGSMSVRLLGLLIGIPEREYDE